nr:hypothetical protein [Tanacetum cinerariifolium]
MATTIEQQVALDEDLVPSTQREILHICPRIPGQAFAELPFEEEILEFIRFLGHCSTIRTLVDINMNRSVHPKKKQDKLALCKGRLHILIDQGGIQTPKHSRVRCNAPIELTNDEIRNTKAYKEYYACATGEAAPKPKASARRKRIGLDTFITPPTATTTPTTTVVVTSRLTAAAKGKQLAKAKSPSDPSKNSSDDEGDDAQEKVSDDDEGDEGKDSEEREEDDDDDDEDKNNVDEQTKGRDVSEGEKTNESDDDNDDQEEAKKGNDDDDNEEEISKIGEQEATESDEGEADATESDKESEDEEIREQEEESFDPIPRTPKESEDNDNNEEDQGLRIRMDERIREEEEADELYRDVDINQGRGFHISQETEDSHVILTPTQSDAQQESSSTSSFMTNPLNPTMDP